MSKENNKDKIDKQLKKKFDESDDMENNNINNDACINYFLEFDKWTVHHYYAMKNREKYPNMFFYYFPRTLFQISKIEQVEKNQIIEYIFKTDEKKLNGKWGYLSLILENPNIKGEQLFLSISNNRSVVNFSNSFPLIEDALPDFDEDLSKKVQKILTDKKDFYNKVLSDFEKYLKEDADITKRQKYINFLKTHENTYIYCDKSKKMCDFISNIIEVNKEKANMANNNIINEDSNIFLKPENFNDYYDYNDNKKNNKIEEEKNNDSNYNSEDNISKKKGKNKRRILTKNKFVKYDFDLDSDENSDNSFSSDYKVEKINSKSKKIIMDEDNDDIDKISNIRGFLEEIPLDMNKDSKSKKDRKSKNSKNSKNSKKSKKDIAYKSEIIYLENNNKENQIKNDFDNIQNTDFKPPTNTMKNQNINYSTNLSSNINIQSSKSNNKNIESNEKNNKIEKIIENKENFDNINLDVEFFQNEQNINGYASDFTKKIYYPKEIKNKILVFSDNEEDNYLKKYAPKKKAKITRIKANENVIIRQKDNIRNYNDFVVIGMETGYIDKNIEKLKRGLMHKKMQIKKRKDNKKKKLLINKLKKEYKEEDFNNKKYKGNYNKFIRERKILEKNKKYKINDNNDFGIKKLEEIKINNIRSKKGNYYEIATQKNFNMDIKEKNKNDININENKNERRFFNCFTNREKEDVNFSDTDSFLSMFNNPKNEGNRRKNKNNNKKFKKDYYDNSRNQNINTFFPKISKDNFIKDRQIVISIRKLIDNEKYEELFNFIKKDINLDSKIPQYISEISNKIFSYSNDINIEKLNLFKKGDKYEIKINNSDKIINLDNNKEHNENTLLINDQFDIEKLFPLMKTYLEKLQISLSFLIADSKYNNNIFKLNYKEEELNYSFMELNAVENLLKLIIININRTQFIDFNQYITNNINVIDTSSNDIIKNEFTKYIDKIKNMFNDSFIDILSEIFITFLRFFISYKPKEIKFMDVEDFCFMSYTFLQIIQALFQKIKELEDINKKLNNNLILFSIPNIITIQDITKKYMKCLCLFLLNNLFIFSTRDFIPLTIKSLKKEANFDKTSSPQESLIIVALFKSISSLYKEINSEDNNEDVSFIMLDNLFHEYLNNDIEIDTSNLGPLNEILIKDLRNYLSSNINSCLSKEKKNTTIIGNIKKVFLYNCFEIDNLIDNDFCIKTMIKKKIIVNLIQRYLFVLLSYFVYYGKNIDCLKYFNDFYSNYNNAIDNKNQNNSYFDVELIKEIIDKNMKLNLNKIVKGYLVEENIYIDVQLMNFYDQYWQIDFDNKRVFIINYFEIMCNYKYKARKIDSIFQKNEILSLINYIFDFKDQQNIINKSIDISQDDILLENENNRENIIKSFDSILIRTIYMISESINKALITMETNNNEFIIKKNLSKIITISNIFANNISQLNSNYYTLFIIPMISTILIFTQHLLKFKEAKNIINTMNKIRDILKFESSGLMLKSFSLSLWINIIQKISEKNNNIEIEKYIEMINSIIQQIVGEYHKPQERGFSMQRYTNPNYDNWNEKKEKEYFEIINDYLLSIKNFADKNPILLIKYYSILNEIYDILNIKFYYPPKMRIQLLEIINILINHINQNNHQINDINILDDHIINSFGIGEENNNFYKFLENNIMPNIKNILDIFISSENTNVMNKKKILYPLYEENALLHANIFGILIKKGIKQNHLEYPSYVFNLYYNNNNDRNNIFDSVFKSIYSNKNETEKEFYIKLPFKLLDIYLNYYPNLIAEIINDKSFILIIKYYLELFFIGIFVNNKKNVADFMNYEIKYCEKIFKNIKMNKELLKLEKIKIQNELQKNAFISEDNKNKICLINLMIILAEINDKENKIGSNEFAKNIIGELLAKLSLNFNVDLIDSEIFFEIINGQKTKIALNKINKLSNFSNKYNSLQSFNENEINVRLHILSKYQERYIKSELNNKFTSYIDDFINELTGEQLISSIVTLKFINSLLTEEKSFVKKFETCLKKVYNTLISRSSNICNILSLEDKERNLKNNFTNGDVNEIISSYNKKYHDYNNLKSNIYNLDISFHLKDNILNKFIKEIPLDNVVSSKFYTSLLINIQPNRNNLFYNKEINKYYEEAIYYYISLCNIMNKEHKISLITKLIMLLYDLMTNNNGQNINYISDLKSFYVFTFFLEKINSLISAVIRIEDLENYSNDSSSFLSDENYLTHNFLMKTINIIECFCSFMYQYIIQVIKGHSLNNKYVHSFIIKKMKSIINKNSPYFNNNRKWDDADNFMNEYLKEKYGKSLMIKGYKIVEKITNNIKIYSRNDDEINKRIDFIKYINFDGIQYFINNSVFKSKVNKQ